MMEFNYSPPSGIVNAGAAIASSTRMTAAIQQLAKELLEQERPATRAREACSRSTTRCAGACGRRSTRRDVPIDVDPIFSFDETVQVGNRVIGRAHDPQARSGKYRSTRARRTENRQRQSGDVLVADAAERHEGSSVFQTD